MPSLLTRLPSRQYSSSGRCRFTCKQRLVAVISGSPRAIRGTSVRRSQFVIMRPAIQSHFSPQEPPDGQALGFALDDPVLRLGPRRHLISFRHAGCRTRSIQDGYGTSASNIPSGTPNGHQQSSRIFRGDGNSRLERAERGYREHCSPTMTLAIRAPVHQSKKVIAMTQRTMPEAIIKSSAAS